MILKLIRVTCHPGRRPELIEKQRVWNDAMARQPGFLGVQVATDPNAPDDVWIVIAMQSREALERFMKGDHDDVARQTSMPSLYERLEVRVVDVVEPGPQEIRLEPAISRSGSGYQIALLAQLFRLSSAVRAATLGGIFDSIGDGASIAELAAETKSSEPHIARLIEALAAIGLVVLDATRVTLAPLAARHLVRSSDAYMGELFLHDSSASLVERWANLGQRLGVVPRENLDHRHALFVRSMSAIARGGQARALVGAMKLDRKRRLLDIGGACGDYAIALCAKYPELAAVVFDQPETEPSARERIESSGVGARVSFVSGDYRKQLPDGRYDVVLLSNVLRGETRADAQSLLERTKAALTQDGLLVVQDLFVEQPRGRGPLLASLFGLHLPDAMNGSVEEVSELIASVGFSSITTRALDGFVIANKLLTARVTS